MKDREGKGSLADRPVEVEFNAQVLTSVSWPDYKAVELTLPPEVAWYQDVRVTPLRLPLRLPLRCAVLCCAVLSVMDGMDGWDGWMGWMDGWMGRDVLDCVCVWCSLSPSFTAVSSMAGA